jgi:hypothetical protein
MPIWQSIAGESGDADFGQGTTAPPGEKAKYWASRRMLEQKSTGETLPDHIY